MENQQLEGGSYVWCGEVMGEKVCHTVEAVKSELVESFGAKEPVIVMSW